MEVIRKKKTVQLVQVPPHFLSKDSRNAETKKMLHLNPQQKKKQTMRQIKKCRTTIIYSKAKQEKKGSKYKISSLSTKSKIT